MHTVLFGWELGANLGHLLPMGGVARELKAEGIEAIYAVRDLGYARTALDPAARILQAPLWPHHRHFGAAGPLASYADILSAVGFGDTAKLAAVVAAWDSLIQLARPDLVVADHSPGLLLALFGSDTPVMAIGAGFTMPPVDGERFPPLRGDRAPVVPETRLLDAVRKVQMARRGAIPGHLTEVFRTSRRVVFGLPELDPYRSFRMEPIAAPPGGLPRPQRWPEERRLFVYLGVENPHLEALARALANLATPVEAYFRGEVGPVPEFLRLRGQVVHDEPPSLEDVFSRASHILTQGGAMTSAAGFSAGRPQLIIPLHDEAEINLQLLERHGTAARLEPSDDDGIVAARLQAFLNNQQLLERAAEQAKLIATRSQPDGGKVALAAIKTCLR